MRRWRRKKNIKKDIKINKNIFLYFYLFLPIFPSAACRNKLLTFNSNDMKKILIWALPLLMGSVCHAEDITIQYNGSTAKVQQKAKDSVNVTVNGASVNIESQYTDHKLTVLLSGKSDDGQLILKTAGKAKVTLNKLNLTSQEGAPLDLRNKKKVEIIAADGTETTLPTTRLPQFGQKTKSSSPVKAPSMSLPLVMAVEASKPRRTSPSKTSPST